MLRRSRYEMIKRRLISVHIEFRSGWKCCSGRNWKSVPAETFPDCATPVQLHQGGSHLAPRFLYFRCSTRNRSDKLRV